MSTVQIRKMTESDRGPVMAILAHWNMAPRERSPQTPEPERVTVHVDNTFVAVEGGEIVGVASYLLHSDGHAETASLAVDPRWRGRGVGEQLQQARLAEMRARGVRQVRTEADRPEVIGWYVRKFGYRVVGRNRKKHEFSLEDVDSWTVLELDLGAPGLGPGRSSSR